MSDEERSEYDRNFQVGEQLMDDLEATLNAITAEINDIEEEPGDPGAAPREHLALLDKGLAEIAETEQTAIRLCGGRVAGAPWSTFEDLRTTIGQTRSEVEIRLAQAIAPLN